jgi:hypothetical protein
VPDESGVVPSGDFQITNLSEHLMLSYSVKVCVCVCVCVLKSLCSWFAAVSRVVCRALCYHS